MLSARHILELKRSATVRNILVLAGGTVFSQAIALLFAPAITRLYGPEAYGVQSVFMSVGSILGGIAALSYPMAIVLARNDDEAHRIVRLSILASILFSILLTAILLPWPESIARALGVSELGRFVLLLPLFAFVATVNSTATQWLARANEFRLTARANIMQSLTTNAVKTGLGMLIPNAVVLILTNTLGILLGALLMFAGKKSSQAAERQTAHFVNSNERLTATAFRYRDFALLRTPQVLINGIAQNIPVLLLASMYNPSSAAFYALANTVLVAPVNLLGNSVMQVFYPRITDAVNRREDSRAILVRATKALALIGIIPFGIIVIAGPQVFSIVFGEHWGVAGSYAQWLSIWMFFQFINKPAVAAIPALGLQRGLLVYELFATGSKAAALYIGFSVFERDTVAVALFSIVGIVAYVCLFAWVIARSRPHPLITLP